MPGRLYAKFRPVRRDRNNSFTSRRRDDDDDDDDDNDHYFDAPFDGGGERGGGGLESLQRNHETIPTGRIMTSVAGTNSNNFRNTPYSSIIQRYINEDRQQQQQQSISSGGGIKGQIISSAPSHYVDHDGNFDNGGSEMMVRLGEDPIFGTSNIGGAEELLRHSLHYDDDDDDDDDEEHEIEEMKGGTWKKLKNLWKWKRRRGSNDDNDDDNDNYNINKDMSNQGRENPCTKEQPLQRRRILRHLLLLTAILSSKFIYKKHIFQKLLNLKKGAKNKDDKNGEGGNVTYPDFVYNHPYVTSSYYTSTHSIQTLEKMYQIQVEPKKDRLPDRERGIVSRLAILRPFCEFEAEALPVTFACWNSLVPCRAAEMDLGDEDEEGEDEWVLFDMRENGNGRKLEEEEEDQWECSDDADYALGDDGNTNNNGTTTSWFRGAVRSLFKKCKRRPKTKEYFDDVSADGLRTTSADLFLFYSQTFSENDVAMKSVDTIMDEFFSAGGWSRCFDNIYAIEANIPKELDLYIPAAQESLYSWVNGPNRQYEAGFRIIQSGEWGDYDGFYLMEGDSVPVKNYWLDVILGEIVAYRPFAVLGAQYDGDKWDAFYEDIPISLLHHTNGNGIYNVSHPLLERLTGHLEVEAPCPYNSIPYDYRMSQMWVEGTLGIVPKLAPTIMLNEEGENITLSDNTAMFSKWANRWKDEEPYRFTKAIHNYAATNLIPRHLGPEYVIHGAKLYSPWDPARTHVTLVIMEWFFDRSLNLMKNLDSKDHPFSQVIIMIPPSVTNTHDYTQYTSVPVTLQFRDQPDVMDLCTANVETEWFMITNSYHLVSRNVDLMFTPGKFVPVVPFTPATYPFCLKYPYCKEIIMLAQRWNPSHNKVVLDMDMLYHTKERNDFCREWTERNGEDGSDLYAAHQPMRWKLKEGKIIGPKGPTGTDYLAYLGREKLYGKMYKMTDRSLYGARAPFVKVYKKEEKLDGMSEDELARRLGMTLLSNTTECSCDRFETEEECLGSGLGCQWRPLFESCHPPEMIDDGIPICASTEPPTMSPTVSIDGELQETEAPTSDDPGSEEKSVEEGGSGAKNRLPYTSFFKTREHESDASVEKDDASEGRRNLRTLLPDESSTQDPLKRFDPISLSDDTSSASSLTESISQGEVDEVGLAPAKLEDPSKSFERISASDSTSPVTPLMESLSRGEIDEGGIAPTDSQHSLKSLDPISVSNNMNHASSLTTESISRRDFDKVGVALTESDDPFESLDPINPISALDNMTPVSSLMESIYQGEVDKVGVVPAESHNPLESFDPISLSDNTSPVSSLMESLSRGEINEVGVAPTESPYQRTAETMCPTWSPSVVPRRLEKLESSSEDNLVGGDELENPLNGTASRNETTIHHDTENPIQTTKLTKHSWPGRVLYTQHQLVQLDTAKSLDSTSVKIPPPDEAKKWRVLVSYGEELGELRFVFDTSSLTKLLREMGQNSNAIDRYNPTKARITAYIDEVFPSIVETWARVLKIYSLSQNIVVPQTASSSCVETMPIPKEHFTKGVADADILFYVETRGEDESSSSSIPCSVDSRPQITICHFDQFMRPLIGFLSICLDDMDIQKNNKVYDRETLYHTALLSQLVGRSLGLSPGLFRYFRDAETGQPWGERKIEVSCGGGEDEDREVKQEIMLSNIIQERTALHSGGEPFYEISTPTVKQVVRNHFDCQTLSGARLSAPTMPINPDNDIDQQCSLFDLDLRFHFDEDMTSISQNADAAHRITPLSLALLEDSSWYVADFAAAKTPSFGRGAGCGFVESSCITGGNVPDYSRGFFCNSLDVLGVRSGCDYTHHNKAGCDLETDASPPERQQYFSEPEYGAKFDDVHYCPMRSKYLVPCHDGKASSSSWSHSALHLLRQLTGESFEENSRYFETNVNIPVCLEAICDPKDKTLSIVVEGKTFYCAYHGQVINVDVGYSVICPRIAAICPELVCPSNCLGKGVCDYCKEVPECICDNPFDQTDGCWDS